jgi:hypothetical protein
MNEANTLVYYDTTTLTAVKSLIAQAPGACYRAQGLKGLTCKYKTRLENSAINKHSSLFAPFVSYEERNCLEYEPILIRKY